MTTPDINEQISFGDIIALLVVRRRLILLATVVCSAVAALAAFNTTPKFRAETLIAPAEKSDPNSGLGALAGQFGGLASLAGVSLNGGGNKSEAIATLSSRALTESYIKQQNLLPILFADRWNSEKRTFKPDSNGRLPTLWDGNKLFAKTIRTVVEDKKSGLVTIAIEWEDPILAAKWANDLVKLTNSTLRERAIAKNNLNLAYLQKQLDKTSVVELRQAIYRLIETEVKNVMIAQGSDEYAFKFIDPAVPPEDIFKPKRGFMIIVGFLIGLSLSSFYAILRGQRNTIT